MFTPPPLLQALQTFQSVLKADPGCPANVRLGIALCLHQLKEPESARAALDRVLELEPDNVEAIAAIAVLKMNQGDVESGMQDMARAIQLHPRHTVILNHIANHLFFKRQYDQTRAPLVTLRADE